MTIRPSDGDGYLAGDLVDLEFSPAVQLAASDVK
jgi:hypothetical protein